MVAEEYFNYAGMVFFSFLGITSISRAIIAAMDIPSITAILESSIIFRGVIGYFIYYYGSLLFAAYCFVMVLRIYEKNLKM